MWSKALSKTTPVSGSFTVPSSATTGSTRMRAMSADGVPSACETFEYGEVEDYSVNIVEYKHKPTDNSNKFNSFWNYSIINKFIMDCFYG
jgi:hypothetical protein